jgi:hypothetical protein
MQGVRGADEDPSQQLFADGALPEKAERLLP